jgi:predicted dehydrogenase
VNSPYPRATGSKARHRPRVGFLGVGWIGRHRMAAMLAADRILPVAVADLHAAAAEQAAALVPGIAVVHDLDALLEAGLDGLVIATPSALHAGQAIRALAAGVAVFCQKPLGRHAGEVSAVVAEARRADRLLGVDLSYRHTAAMLQIRELVRGGALGEIYAVDLLFHNAYGPDKAWFYDPSLSGGGCVTDLGIHLVDLALWALDFPPVEAASSALFAAGERLADGDKRAEDFATATLTLASGAVLRLACSWRLPAGRDAVIGAAFYGTEGGAALGNVDGSFYDFRAERYLGTRSELLCAPPDDWGGRAAIDWATRLAAGQGFDPAATELVTVAEALDRIYGR